MGDEFDYLPYIKPYDGTPNGATSTVSGTPDSHLTVNETWRRLWAERLETWRKREERDHLYEWVSRPKVYIPSESFIDIPTENPGWAHRVVGWFLFGSVVGWIPTVIVLVWW